MNLKVYRSCRELIYVLGFFFVIFLRWNCSSFDEKMLVMVGNEIFLFPAILVICLFYFYQFYYGNVFVQARFGVSNARKQCFIGVVKESFYFPTYIVCLSVILSVWDLGMDYIHTLLIYYCLIVSFFLLLGCIFFICFLNNKKFYYSIIFNFIPIFIYKYYVIWWHQYLSSPYDMTRINNNVYLLLLNVMVISCVLLIQKYKYLMNSITLSRIHKMILIYSIIEYLSLVLLKPYTINPNTFSFMGLLSTVATDTLVVVLYWIFPKIFIIMYSFKNITENYNSNIVFYMTRILNREKWLRNICYRVTLLFVELAIIKLLMHIIIFRAVNIEIIGSLLVYIAFMLFVWCSVVCVYLLFKDDDVLNIYMLIYLTVVLIAAVYSMDFLGVILLNASFMSIVIFIGGFLLCYLISVYVLNHCEYYGL